MTLSASEKKKFRQIAHHLDAIVMIGDQGVSAGVIQETERALSDHELIKVKIAIVEREDRKAAAAALATACNAELVHTIGKVVVLFRANKKANPKLSNILRFT